MFNPPSYYIANREKVLLKARQKEKCECGVEVSYSNRKCHKQSLRHMIWLKSMESEKNRLDNQNGLSDSTTNT